MKYYLGTKSECEDYDTKVTEGENYVPGTYNWDNPRKTSELGVYGIQKHDNYTCDLTLKDESEVNFPENDTIT